MTKKQIVIFVSIRARLQFDISAREKCVQNTFLLHLRAIESLEKSLSFVCYIYVTIRTSTHSASVSQCLVVCVDIIALLQHVKLFEHEQR
jgi:integral membrane sensor domain MASE1